MDKLKVMTIVGTRPELIKLCRVIAELDAHTNHVFVHTGQNHDYELNEIFFEQLEIRQPDHFLNAANSGGTPMETIAGVLTGADRVIEQEQPDAMLLLGDTNSCLAAIAAKRRKVPVFHMEAGNRCFDERVPEEINRRIIDHISDINMPYTEHARRYLLNEGLRGDCVIKTGSPMREVLEHYRAKIDASDILNQLQLNPHDYFVVSAHREENVDSEQNLSDLIASLNAIAECHDKPIIFSVHPRTRKRIDESVGAKLDDRVRELKPLGFLDYIKLQSNAICVISDSGTITEESSILNFPAVTIRQSHERPEGMDEGTLVMCGLKPDRVLQAIDLVTTQHDPTQRQFAMAPDYESTNVSQKIVRIIHSYMDSVNRNIWQKPQI
jgi:UDP-N-acetylglucosamine 2-epimerase (non-hydrolysing)